MGADGEGAGRVLLIVRTRQVWYLCARVTRSLVRRKVIIQSRITIRRFPRRTKGLALLARGICDARISS